MLYHLDPHSSNLLYMKFYFFTFIYKEFVARMHKVAV